jgi:hypothetical protein
MPNGIDEEPGVTTQAGIWHMPSVLRCGIRILAVVTTRDETPT